MKHISKYFLVISCVTILLTSHYGNTMKISQEAIDITSSPEKIVPQNRMAEVKKAWQEINSSQQSLFAIPGRPDIASPTWHGFVAKVEHNNNDYTIFTFGNSRDQKKLDEQQTHFISLVNKQDTKNINKILTTANSTSIYRTDEFLSELLKYVWHDDFRVKATAIYTLALLSKEQKLSDYVYRVWAQAAVEGNYKYLSDPFFEPGTCRTWIYQLGIHTIDDSTYGESVGLAHASCMPGGVSMPLVRRTMSEDFYIVSGEGEFVINDGITEKKFIAKPGTYFQNPCGMHIQFRNTGDVPLTMLVPTYPPYDNVIPFPSEKEFPIFNERLSVYLKKTNEEIHKVHGQIGSEWNLPEYNEFVNVVKNEVEKLLINNEKEQAAKDLTNPLTPYLRRYFIITLSDKLDFINEKKNIVNNEKENWGLRKAAKESLSK